jgi:thiol:disulfide interchange protein DsbC
MPGIESVTATPIKGIYEVIGEANVLYVTEDLSYIFSGHILNVKTKSSLTDPVVKKMQARDIERQARVAESMKDTIKTTLVANQKNFLKEVKGNGKDVIYMVTDIRCGFCRAMEKNFDQMNDITIYRIPVALLGPESFRLSNAAWCAKDRLAAWKDLTDKKATIAKEADCITPIKDNSELMDTWKVRGTPTFFREDGQRWTQGLMSPELTKIFIQKGTYETVQAKAALDSKTSSATTDRGVK